MIIIQNNFMIRHAEAADAPLLCSWWNNGEVMAHAGFPDGLHTTEEEVAGGLAGDSDENGRRHIILLSEKPIGEMHYRRLQGGTAEIGIKICDFTEQEKGYGTILLALFIDALFTYYHFQKIILDTNVKNKQAQHVYEKKLGFTCTGVLENAWKDQRGSLQSSICYALTKEDWQSSGKKPHPYIHLRLESPADYHAVEEMTRNAFWKNSRQICDEHLLVRKLRKVSAFVPELDYIAELDGELAGHIIYSKSYIEDAQGIRHEMLTFGPLSVQPKMQNQGVGKALLCYTLGRAGRLGYRAVLIFGHPDYYPRVGFQRASAHSITANGGGSFDPFMIYPLYDGAMDGISGSYSIDPVYYDLKEEEVRAFDQGFPEKEAYMPVPFKVLLDQLEPDACRALGQIGCLHLDVFAEKSEREIASLEGIDTEAIKTIKKAMRENGFRWGRPAETA